uniref:Uncharacterized protein n=1 Tax=Aegilops tauschii subsp. strangulata TaxID=200361 RepID=A0A453AE96_AEGTS
SQTNLVNLLQYQLLCFVFMELILYPHNNHLTGCAHNTRANIFFTDNGFNPCCFVPHLSRCASVTARGTQHASTCKDFAPPRRIPRSPAPVCRRLALASSCRGRRTIPSFSSPHISFLPRSRHGSSRGAALGPSSTSPATSP